MFTISQSIRSKEFVCFISVLILDSSDARGIVSNPYKTVVPCDRCQFKLKYIHDRSWLRVRWDLGIGGVTDKSFPITKYQSCKFLTWNTNQSQNNCWQNYAASTVLNLTNWTELQQHRKQCAKQWRHNGDRKEPPSQFPDI